MILTFELDPDSVTVNQHANYFDQRYFVQKLLSGHKETHRTDLSIWTTTKVKVLPDCERSVGQCSSPFGPFQNSQH